LYSESNAEAKDSTVVIDGVPMILQKIKSEQSKKVIQE